MKIWERIKDLYWDIRHWLFFGEWPMQGAVLDLDDYEVAHPPNVTVIEGIRLVNVHPKSACAGRVCVIHNPTDHRMRSWKLLWRSDRGIFERLCPAHGVGHPDPDQGPYWRETGQEIQAIHGCCGCCFMGSVRVLPEDN